jgi:hypothetical protein
LKGASDVRFVTEEERQINQRKLFFFGIFVFEKRDDGLELRLEFTPSKKNGSKEGYS